MSGDGTAPARGREAAPARFAGVDHVAFTVTDLEASRRFYCEVLGFVAVMDVGSGRILMHPGTGFVLTVLNHDGAHGGPFSELHTGVDHIGLTAASREELESWQRHLERHAVPFTPIRDETFGAHLNFRDPDGMALELTAANELMTEARAALASGQLTAAEIAAFVAEHVGPELVVDRAPE